MNISIRVEVSRLALSSFFDPRAVWENLSLKKYRVVWCSCYSNGLFWDSGGIGSNWKGKMVSTFSLIMIMQNYIFKVCVEDKWHKLICEAGEGFVCKPKVMRAGHTMTVAQWKDWLAFDSNDKLDIYNTVEHLKSAEKVLDDAVKMADSAEGPIQSNFS